MSSAASWSYTAQATLWPAQSASSDWDGSPSWGAPVLLACDYKADAKLMRSAEGEEFTSTLMLYTEHATAKAGDMVALGDQTSSGTPTADAAKVMLVTRYADTLDRVADDFVIIT